VQHHMLEGFARMFGNNQSYSRCHWNNHS